MGIFCTEILQESFNLTKFFTFFNIWLLKIWSRKQISTFVKWNLRLWTEFQGKLGLWGRLIVTWEAWRILSKVSMYVYHKNNFLYRLKGALVLSFPKLFVNKKSHICEDGEAHLRIFFCHSLINFEKPEKSGLKKLLEISFYTCVRKNTIIWGAVPEIQSETELFVILDHFLPCYPLLTKWGLGRLKYEDYSICV